MRASQVVVGVALLSLLVLAGCSGDDGGDDGAGLTDATPPTAGDEPTATVDPTEAPSTDLPSPPAGSDPAEADGLEFRPVLAILPPPCDSQQFEDRAGQQCYVLGPVAVDESAIESASAFLEPSAEDWAVAPVLLPGEDGIDRFNAIAEACFAADPSCPTQQLAIVLDGKVLSAPSVQEPTFERDALVVEGGFTEDEAKALAEALDA